VHKDLTVTKELLWSKHQSRHVPFLLHYLQTSLRFSPNRMRSSTHSNMPASTFDELLNLEEQFYDEGYQQGLADGAKAGLVEGRTFGLEKGFEKYVESGRLHGKALIWANRMPQFRNKSLLINHFSHKSESIPKPNEQSTVSPQKLPDFQDNARLAKHIRVLHALAESESLSTENTEDAVSDFDDRVKRAHVKARIIERITGEAREEEASQGKAVGSRDGSIEDVSVLKARH
jgi:flagellar biosynthesis/type III secretory pathway protein FliH